METATAVTTDQPTKQCPRCGERLEAWASICPQCMYEWHQEDPAAAPEAKEQAKAVEAFDYQIAKNGPSPRVVYTLIAINILVFICMAINGVNILTPEAKDLFRWGANFPPATVHGQWWRLLTSTFIHIGIIHLAFNMYVLYAGGLRMERILGYSGFLTTYFLSGLAGSVATLAFHPAAVGAGASGAIFGIYGALLGFLAKDRTSIPRPVFVAMGKSTLVFLGYNLLFSLKPGIDLSAHCGGLITGFICGLALCEPVGTKTHSLRAMRTGLTFIVGTILVGTLAGGVLHFNREDLNGGIARLGVAPIEEGMKRIIQEHFDSRKDIAGVKVRKVIVLEHEGNDFTGTTILWWIDREVSLSIKFKIEGQKVAWSLGTLPLDRTHS